MQDDDDVDDVSKQDRGNSKKNLRPETDDDEKEGSTTYGTSQHNNIIIHPENANSNRNKRITILWDIQTEPRKDLVLFSRRGGEDGRRRRCPPGCSAVCAAGTFFLSSSSRQKCA